jgi:hypothetical protein
MRNTPRPDPGVVTTPVPGGETILLHLGTRQYFSLNQTGTLLWKLIEGSTPLAGLSQALFDRFEITPEAAGESVRELIETLRSHNLITIPELRP